MNITIINDWNNVITKDEFPPNMEWTPLARFFESMLNNWTTEMFKAISDMDEAERKEIDLVLCYCLLAENAGIKHTGYWFQDEIIRPNRDTLLNEFDMQTSLSYLGRMKFTDHLILRRYYNR